MKPILNTAALALGLLLLAGCGAPDHGDGPESVAARVERAADSDADVVVFKSPTCGCCNGWIDHLRAAGYTVEAVDLVGFGDLADAKRAAGVPADLGSCHTAVIDGYAIEGHVPAESIERLLRERPDIVGLSVPGMPIGSPGMEGPDPEVYDVIAFTADGRREVFRRVDPRQPSSDAR